MKIALFHNPRAGSSALKAKHADSAARPRGKRRIHQKPSSREIEACRPWLNAEIRSLEPQFLVCLGATAVRSVFGKDLSVLKNRGRWMPSLFSPKTLITIHPSSILRAPDEPARERAYADFIADLRVVARGLQLEA
jgi:uracil-DNA glycosylase